MVFKPKFRGHDDMLENDVARGKRLSMAMAARGLNYNCQFCYELGVTESSLSRWRSGGPMSVSMAVRLAQALEVSIDWLITGRSEKSAAQAGTDSELGEATSLFAVLMPATRKVVLELSTVLSRNSVQNQAL